MVMAEGAFDRLGRIDPKACLARKSPDRDHWVAKRRFALRYAHGSWMVLSIICQRDVREFSDSIVRCN